MAIHTETSQGSSSTSDLRYDVFLSSKGSDTGNNFTDHLYNALIDSGINTFLDDEEIETGEDLKPELEDAIRSSRASVIVLSKNYATSTWCLDELALILHQRLTADQIVIPIFYHVEPTNVRKQQNSFGDAMAEHRQKMEAETNAEKRLRWGQKMDGWIKALTDVADLKGKDVKGRKETYFIEEIVTDIRQILGVPLSDTLPLLIGRDHQIEGIKAWLTDGSSSHTADILTVLGMGGIGKTCLAKYVFHLHSPTFEKSSFIEGINLRCTEKFNGLLDVQQQLYGDISIMKKPLVHDTSAYTSKIEKALASVKVFLVLDDIGSLDQLDALLGNKGFHPGSKVLITTTDASLTERCALFKSKVKPKHTKLLTEGLYEPAAVELLCLHAFKCKHPKQGYEEFIEKLVKYCDGHPLALEALGRSLYNRETFYWEECVENLKTELDYRIYNALIGSFYSLSNSNDKELFKHIVCFFVGMHRDIVETILKACNINTSIGITNLVDRCLLRIGSTTELAMHSLIQEMGRYLVCQESPDRPWKRSRLWCHEESYQVIEQNKGTKSIEGLALDMRMIDKEGSTGLETDALSKMDNLKLLQLNYVQLNGSYNKFPRKLRWLCMHGFPLKSVPSDLPMQNLAVLDMSYSSIESFDMSSRNLQRPAKRQKLTCSNGQKLLGSLKVLNLSYCAQLHSVGGFCELPALESLYLTNCESLIEVCESIEQSDKLVLIDLSNCKEYTKLPKTIENLKNLKSLLLDGCKLDETRDVDSLEMLNADSSDITAHAYFSVVDENIPRDALEATSSFSSPNDNTYDVFISFRATDTWLGFTAHLLRAFKEANIETFYHDKEIEAKLYSKSELEKAIEASRAYVVVLSKTYASSTKCLEELVSILEQRRNSKRIVIPIFYHVEPTHFMKQHESSGDPMAELKKKMEAETNSEVKSQLAQKIKIWSIALSEVSYMEWYSKDWLETQIIEKIVEDVNHSLPLRNTLPDLIGVDYPVRFISSWLNDGSTHTADILTITGIRGIGKTSLAEYIYGLHCHLFQSSSFIDDINRKCQGQSNKLLDLQKQLCADISKTYWIHVDHISVCTAAIENAVACRKVLLVLDDIDNPDQLDALLGNKGFHPGSKVIITTKDASLIERCALFNLQVQPKHTKVLLKDLNETSSLQLFSYHAFGYIDPTESYKQVSKKLVKLCDGLPLALKVLGRSLFDRDEFEWGDCLENLKEESDSDTEKVLRFSFDSLPSKNAKELFKYIACFFVGKDRDSTETILKACEIHTKLEIANLIDRCLLTVGPNNELMMHELLQEMGRNVVRQESIRPWERSRLWCHEESFQVLNRNKGAGNLKGIVLDSRMLEKEKLLGSLELESKVLSKMNNLMLLQLNYVLLRGSYANFPHTLRWLCMYQFPLEHIPSNIPMENLVALDMSYSKFKSFDMSCNDSQRFEKTQTSLGSLKVLNLSFCKQLRFVGGFCKLPSLERLMLTNCIGLIMICESIKHCGELILVDLSYCTKLENFLRSIGKLKKLQTLFLDGCGLCEFPVAKRDVDSLDVRVASNGYINSEISSSAIVETLQSNLNSLGKSFLTSLVSLSLANNNLSNDSFTTDFSSLSMLKVLILDGNPIVSLPDCVRHLHMLEKLSMKNCNMLRSIEGPPQTLSQLILDTYDCQHNRYSFLRKIKFKHEMSPLKLSVDPFLLAPSLFEIDGIVKIQPMSDVEGKLLHSLGWSNLAFVKRRHLETYDSVRGIEGFKSQMYYEFGVFSTIYGGEKMPNWISDTSEGSSISVTIPSSPDKLRGLNFCYVQKSGFSDEMFRYSYDEFFSIPPIKITNKTKNRTWIYKHYIDNVSVGGKYITVLTHWMFGMDDMEAGDHITVNITDYHGGQVTKECGIGLVYNDGNMEEEIDTLGYYKSWNHIIGGDLSAFQLTTGDYFLHRERFIQHTNICLIIGFDTRYKEMNVPFRAFSQRKSSMVAAS
uniref:inactive disease resistance protein RPS4-like n=1 Tax=Erigeron canadensis TaxID=72917 RepID=UPI001CB92FA8|nr:inactive disease resistance protein RPS4-like [Erigeron canadensis]